MIDIAQTRITRKARAAANDLHNEPAICDARAATNAAAGAAVGAAATTTTAAGAAVDMRTAFCCATLGRREDKEATIEGGAALATQHGEGTTELRLRRQEPKVTSDWKQEQKQRQRQTKKRPRCAAKKERTERRRPQ